MAKLIVPASVIDGFKEIAKLNENQISELSDYLKNLEVGTKFNNIDTFISSKFKFVDSTKTVQTILSCGELLDPENVRYEELAHELTESVKQSLSNEDEVSLDNLEFNLIKIFENYRNLRLTIKAYSLILENSNVYVESKIITDIRLIFNDNLTESNRNGVIIHRLHFTIQNRKENSDFIISLDNSDLKSLKDAVDRALLKEDIIKEDYENIHFINQ